MQTISANISRRMQFRASVPARVWTLALLDATSAVGLAGLAAAPLGTGAPVHLDAVCAGVLAAVAAVLLVSGGSIARRWLLGLGGLRIMVAILAIGTAHSGGATFFAGAGLVWVALWVTGFFSRRLVVLTLAAEFGAVALAVAVNGQHLRTAVDAGALLVAAVILSILLLQSLGRLRIEARHDHLTGLLNRYGVDEALAELSSRQRPATASIVAIDLDGLKAVNDEGGHQAGDRMLVTFATELTVATRVVDLPARVGGDEFIAILPGLSAAEATRWAGKLQERSCVSWSFGVAERRFDEPLELWLGRADQGMYAAKSAGRSPLRSVSASV
ncbi:MAG TPA: GGDEF domain-containing protein [Solirubrobacteraceae bacterium]|jgi:diguanylate cyclase (GGDEF)-like protein|nr:GGDEF domain-containing protein [Solirubrobacteraceae bacterium]